MNKTDIDTKTFYKVLWKDKNNLGEKYGYDNFMLICPTIIKMLERTYTPTNEVEIFYENVQEIDYAIELNCFNLYNFFTVQKQLNASNVAICTDVYSFSFQKGLSLTELSADLKASSLSVLSLFELYNTRKEENEENYKMYIGHKPFLTSRKDYVDFKTEVKETKKLSLKNIISIFL
jgi:hypothetical protein